MRFISFSFLLFYFCFFVQLSGTSLFANQEGTTSTPTTHESPANLSRWRIFGGVGAGYGRASGDDYFQAAGGPTFLLNTQLSYLLSKWEIAGGVGWMYSSLSGTNSQNIPISLRTRFGFVDLSPRYRFNEHWQLGPVFTLAFGTDTAFGPQVSSSSTTKFIGLKGAYEFNIQQFPVQLWAQVSHDVSLSDRQALLAIAGIQFGFPFQSNSKKNPDSETFSSSETIHLTHASSESHRDHPVTIVLDYQKVFFGTNSSKLRPGVTKVLAELGAYLKENPQNTADIDITGHADKRGSFKYNLKLSKLRSDEVRKTLLSSGVDPLKLHVQGYSYSRPLDSKNNREAWAKNRRVEMVFNQVVDPAPLKRILYPLTFESPQTFH